MYNLSSYSSSLGGPARVVSIKITHYKFNIPTSYDSRVNCAIQIMIHNAGSLDTAKRQVYAVSPPRLEGSMCRQHTRLIYVVTHTKACPIDPENPSKVMGLL